jgi:DNA polymerase-3 subunit delta'
MEMKLRDFVGNQKWVRLLRKAELPHSMIFSGPEGIGKKTLAILLAGLANCQNPKDGDLCGFCNSCKRVQTLPLELAKRNHPDILVADWPWVERACKEEDKKKKPNPLVIPIHVVRNLIQEAQYRPFLGAKRFFILDDAEKLNEAAANAFLKTLEEPPETTYIVLVTAYPDRLLPTIQSRCQHIRFGPLSRA